MKIVEGKVSAPDVIVGELEEIDFDGGDDGERPGPVVFVEIEEAALEAGLNRGGTDGMMALVAF